MAINGFSPDWLGELKARNDIVTTVSHYIKLDRKGKSHWGCCPFHFEKTPSFAVNETDQYFHCFGCGVSGDVIAFVQKYENLDFMEAVQLLAKNAGMEVPTLENNEEIAKRKEEKEQILHALRESAIFYRQVLLSQVGKPAMDYLKNRGVSLKSITNFGLGYSPDFESVKKHLQNKGYSLELLKKAGIIEISNGKSYDFYAGRLMFPLINMQGEVVGFSGRLIEKKDFAKYKNSPQTIVFDKSRTIFGINLLKKLRNETKTNLKNIILVEGQLDVVAMHQAGFNNAVACLGTALTPLHCKELEKLTENVILMLDGDGAGQKATLRSLNVLFQNSELSVKVAVLPDGLDPDEFLKKYDKSKMEEILNAAVEALDYQITSLAANFDLESNEQRAKFVKQALAIIKTFNKDASSQEIYLKKVGKLANLPADVLRQDLQNLDVSAVKVLEEEKMQEPEKLSEDAYIMADKFVLASLLFRKPYANIEDCAEIGFLDKDLNDLYEYIKQGTKDKPALVSGVFDRIDVENNPLISEIINFPFTNEEKGAEIWQDCLVKNKERALDREKELLEKEWKTGDLKQRVEILKKMQEIDKRRYVLRSKKDTLA